MRKFACLLAIAAAPVLTAGAAHAQPAPSQGTSAPRPEVTVRGPERLVCRSVRRTSTRMRASRVCRPVSQLTAEGQRSDDEQIADAADTLDVLGADDLSTNCVGNPMDMTPDTPLGPRWR